MIGDGRYILGEDGLQITERGEWIISVWTYQEVVNSRKPCSTTIGDAADKTATTGVIPGLGISRYNFFHCISHSLIFYTRYRNLTLFGIRKVFHDWMLPKISQPTWQIIFRSLPSKSCRALTDVSVIERRENRFYSMIGAITQSPQDYTPPYTSASSGPSGNQTIPDLAESFMKICESKGDFSFTFSSAECDNAVGRRWRPETGHIPSVLPWTLSGSGPT
jgi:hypothetical protein